MWEDIISWSLKALVLPLLLAIIKGRDMVLANTRKVKELEDELEEMRGLRLDDLKEQKTLIGLATSIDTKIDLKMRDFMAQANDIRREETQVFTKAIHEMDKTLSSINQTLVYLNKDIETLKAPKQ